ncbi:MAG TPA: UPF0175 family protein [Terriglobia bacterium]|nr:UPF0175 family protein [Terriglobia bacterium]
MRVVCFPGNGDPAESFNSVNAANERLRLHRETWYKDNGDWTVQVAIDLADDIAEELSAKWSDLPRQALEALAAEGYRTEALSEEQVRRMLGYESRFQVHAFLKEHGIDPRHDLADLEHKGQAGDAHPHSDWDDFERLPGGPWNDTSETRLSTLTNLCWMTPSTGRLTRWKLIAAGARRTCRSG